MTAQLTVKGCTPGCAFASKVRQAAEDMERTGRPVNYESLAVYLDTSKHLLEQCVLIEQLAEARP